MQELTGPLPTRNHVPEVRPAWAIVFYVEEEQQHDQGEHEDVSNLVDEHYSHGILERIGTMFIESDKKHRRET